MSPLSGHPVLSRLLRFAGLWLLGLVLAVVVFRQNVVQRTHTFYGDWDASIQSYAWNTANARAVRELHFKLWDFTTSSGTSFAGEMQTAPFYPANWIFAWLGDPASVEVQEWRLLAHFALAFAGAWGLLRHQGRSRAATAVGALLVSFVGSFALRAPAQPNIFESLSWLPLVVWLCQRALAAKERPWLAPAAWQAGCACGLMFLAGHLQPPVHTGLAVAILALFAGPWGWRALGARALTLGFIGAVAVLLALPQLAATVEYLAHSYRWIGAAEPTAPPHHVPYEIYAFKYVLHGGDWRLLFSPSATGAEGCTLFAGFSGLALAAIGLLRPGRSGFFALTLGTVAVLISMGDGSWLGRLSYHVPGLNSVRTPVRALCLYHLAVGLLAAGGVDLLRAWCARWSVRAGPVLAWTLAVGVAAEVAVHGIHYLKPRTAEFYPARYYGDTWMRTHAALTRAEPGAPVRFIALPNEAVPPNLGNVDDSLSMRGHRATMQMRYFKYLGRDWSPTGENFRRLGLRYIFSRDPIDGLREVSAHDGLRLYERADALSVFQVKAGDSVRSARLRHVEWEDNAVQLEPEPGESGRLVFAQVKYPGWEARIDGRRVPLSSEDVFLALDLPAGARRVEFLYRPAWFWPALLAALVVAFTTAAFTWRATPREDPLA